RLKASTTKAHASTTKARASTTTDARAKTVDLVHVGRSDRQRRADRVAVEEPLEIRVNGTTLLVTMRTPGADRQLAAGLLLSERIIHSADDVATIRHCTLTDADASENVIDVTLGPEASARARERVSARRLVATTSACGVCGRQ